MIHYILQILAFQLLFLIVFDLFLKKETFFNWNRAYLLATPLLSFILPFIKIEAVQQHIPNKYIIQLPAVLIGDTASEQVITSENTINQTKTMLQSLSLVQVFEYIWYIGILISTLLFCYKLFTILQLKRSGTKVRLENFNLIWLPNTDAAFSFFNTIFLGKELSENKKYNILLHEKIHITHYHSVDLLFFEILRILCWFNPLVYVYQKRMMTLQEYIADARAVIAIDKKEYYQDLLSQTFQTRNVSFINTFFNHSLIKNRIIMLQKSKSKKIFQLKYLLLIPVISVILVYTSCTQDSNAQGNVASQKASSDSEILKNIEALKESIAVKGNMTEEEEKALKGLLLLTTPNGFSEPFFEDVIEYAEIPFGVIEKVPVYPGCENLSQEETKKCFSNKISQFVGQEFNTKLAKENNLTGRQKVYVRFTIDKTGKVKEIKTKAKSRALREEAIRLVHKLPKMTPGEQDGKKVGVVYSLPIIFEVNE